MKHRDKLAQAQRQRAASPNNAAELEEDELLPGKPKPKKRGGSIHAARAKHHLGKRGRIGLKPKRFDSGGTAGGTRSLSDPGDEIAAANKERKGTLGRISDELLGTRAAYKRGGGQRPQKFDAGGAAQPSNSYEGSLLQQFNTTPQLNPVVKFVKQNNPPPSLQTHPPAPPDPSGPFRPRMPSAAHKEGGRVRKSRQGTTR
jgi:hypothetical protein